jgi:hypothetical protein
MLGAYGAIQGFIGSRWMPPSGECMRCIAPAATMVLVVVKKRNANKTHNF